MAVVQGDTFEIPIKADTREFNRQVLISVKIVELSIKRMSAQLQSFAKEFKTIATKVDLKSVNTNIKNAEKNIKALNSSTVNAAQSMEEFSSVTRENTQAIQGQQKVVEDNISVIELLFKSLVLFGTLKIATQFRMIERSGTLLGVAIGKLLGQFRGLNTIGPPSSKTVFKIGEAMLLLTPAVVALGRALSESEIAIVSFVGKATALFGVALVSLTAGLNLATQAISGFAIGLGDKLINRMTLYSESAEKAEEVTSAFTFTILGFNRVVGESTGTLDFWNDQIDNLVDTTALGVGEIQKSISLLVKEGAALGLNATQNAKLLRVAADIAAATGKDLNDVTLRIVSGLAGQTQGLLALGINVKEAAIDHSVFAKELGKTASELTETEAKMIRFNEILKQSEPLLGAATNQLDTVRGANEAYERTLENIRIKIGETNEVTKAYQRTLTQIAESFLDLPDIVLETVGVFIDFGGVTLKVVGTLVKYLLTIGFIVTAISTLNLVMGTSITVQSILGAVFTATAAKVGVQAVAITGLNAVLLNMALIIKGTLITAIKFLAISFVTLTAKVFSLTAALLTNPLFLAGAAIAAGIYLLVDAFRDIADEMGFFTEESEKANGVAGEFTGVLVTLKNAARAVFGVFKDLAKLIVVGLTAPVLFAVKAWLHMKEAMADNENEAFGIRQEIEEINEQLEKLGEISLKAQSGFRGLVSGGTAEAAERQRIEYEKLGASVENFSSKLEKVKSVTKEIGEQFRLLNTGDQFDKAKNKVDATRTAYNQLVDRFINGGKDAEVSVDDLKKGYENLLGAFQKAKDLSEQTFNGLIAGAKRVNLELLKSSGQVIEVARIENAERLKLFDEQVENLRKLGNLTVEQEKQLADARITIVRKGQADINKILASQDNARKAAMDGIAAKNRSFEIERLQSLNLFVDAQKLKNQAALDAFDKEAEKIKATHDLRQEDIDLINKTREALLRKNEAALGEAEEKQQQAAQDAANEGGVQIFGEQQVSLITSAFGEAAGGIASAASSMLSPATTMMAAAQATVGAIQQLIDFGPQFLDSIANVFNSLTDLPLKLAESFGGVLDSITNLITNLPANLIKGIDQILVSIVDFLFEGLPKALEDLPILLIDALLAFVEKLPALVGKFAQGMIRVFVTAPILLINGLVKGIPVLIGELVRAIPEVALALVNGVVLGLKEAINALANLLGFEDIFNIPDVEDKIKGLGDDIKRASSQIFEVLDLEAAGRGLDVADRIRNALASGSLQGASFFERLFKKIGQFGTDLWNGFVGAVEDIAKWFGDRGTEIWNGFILPIATWFGDRGTEIWNGFILPIATWFGDRGTEIWNGFILPIANFFSDAGTKIWNGFILPVSEWFGDRGTEIWNGFVLPIATFFKDMGKQIWDGFVAPIGIFFSNAGKAIWDGFITPIGDFFKNAGKAIWDGFIGPVGAWFSDRGKELWDSLSSLIVWPEITWPVIPTPGWLQSFIDAINKLTNFKLNISTGGLVGNVQNITSNAVSKVVSTGKDAGGAISSGFKRAKSKLFADGGYVSPNSIDIPSGKVIDSILYAQQGAFTPGNVGTDTVDAKLTPGEFVVNREATRNNLGLLSFINQAREPVSPVTGTNNFSIVINARTDLSADQIRREVVPELEKHLRRKSQEGRSVINAAGIRT